MKLDFKAAFTGQISYADLIRDVHHADLITLTNEVLDALAAQLPADAPESLFTFAPADVEAEDGTGWTLGHVIAHANATMEETAAIAAMMARGVSVEQRLRYEVPWEELNTQASAQARLNESRRMCLAFLNAWPDEPHLDLTVTRIPQFGPMNAIGLYVLGLGHAQMHVQQLSKIVQAYSQTV